MWGGGGGGGGGGQRATAAAVSAEQYLDMHDCEHWVTGVAINPINYSTFDALLHCVKYFTFYFYLNYFRKVIILFTRVTFFS